MGAAGGLIEIGLVLCGALVAQRRVATLTIVEHLDVPEQGPLSSLARWIGPGWLIVVATFQKTEQLASRTTAI